MKTLHDKIAYTTDGKGMSYSILIIRKAAHFSRHF